MSGGKFPRSEEEVGNVLVAHSFSPDGSEVAVARGGRNVSIYSVEGDDCKKWVFQGELKQHDQRVLDVAWSPSDKDYIVTCGEDRSAFVWYRVTLKSGKAKWTHQLVNLSTYVNRATLSVQWSPHGDKFALGSAANRVSVCNYEQDNDWWISVDLKPVVTSAVTAVAWNPTNNDFLAAAGTDQQVHFFVAPKGQKGEHQYDVDAKGWIHAVAWSPDGNVLGFVSHDSTLSFVDPANSYEVTTIKTKFLPFNTLAFVNDSTVVAGGGDCHVYAFTKKGKEWSLTGRFEAKKAEAKKNDAISAARSAFVNQASMGQATAVTSLDSVHQAPIAQIKVLAGGDEYKFSSIGHDGTLYIWESKHLVKQ